MRATEVAVNRRVLLVDDNREIHEDYRRVLESRDTTDAVLSALDQELFGTSRVAPAQGFDTDSAFQGHEALAKVKAAIEGGHPYVFAFVDVRMAPGWDGVKTTAELLKADPDLGIVICSAYSDHCWEDLAAAFGDTDRVLVLKKPFDTLEVRQLASALRRRWQLAREAALTVIEEGHRLEATTQALQVANESVAESLGVLHGACLEGVDEDLPPAFERAFDGVRRVTEIVRSMQERPDA